MRARGVRDASSRWPSSSPTAASRRSTRALCFSTVGDDDGRARAWTTWSAALEAQSIPVEQYYPELGHGQQEMSIRHAARARPPPTTRSSLARRSATSPTTTGCTPRSRPSRSSTRPATAAHIHFSLWDKAGQRNLMYDPSGAYGVSAARHHFIAGVLEHLPALLALTCP